MAATSLSNIPTYASEATRKTSDMDSTALCSKAKLRNGLWARKGNMLSTYMNTKSTTSAKPKHSRNVGRLAQLHHRLSSWYTARFRYSRRSYGRRSDLELHRRCRCRKHYKECILGTCQIQAPYAPNSLLHAESYRMYKIYITLFIIMNRFKPTVYEEYIFPRWGHYRERPVLCM